MLFTLTDISAQIPPQRFDEGWQLFTDGRISAPNIQRGGELITAIIPHPGSRPIRVYIRTDKAGGAIIINGECSCVKKRNCEHVAAVLLQALQDKQALPASPPKAHKKNKPATSPQQALLYVLQPGEDGLLIETFAARRLKNGQYSGGAYFEPSRAARHAPARFLVPTDLELLDALNQLPRSLEAGTPVLDGAQSSRILEAILASGRCFLQDIQWGSSLTQGVARALKLRWETDDFGNQCCDWTLEPGTGQLLLLSSPWYLDDERGQCGPVASDLPAALITELLNLPAVEAGQVNTLQDDLLQRYPGADIPLPQRFELITTPQVKPTPCLCLTSAELSSWGDWRKCRDFARLGFEYDGIRLAYQGPSTHFDGKRVTRVSRNKRAEQAAVKQLRKWGFKEGEDWELHAGNNCFFLQSGLMDSDTKDWLDFQMEGIPKLRAQGWHIDYDNFRFQLVEASQWYCDVDQLERQDWFSIGLGIEIDGRRVDLLPTLLEYLHNFPRGLPNAEEITTQSFVIPLVDEPGDEQLDEQLGERLLLLPAKRVLPLL